MRNSGYSCPYINSVPWWKRTAHYGSFFGGIPPLFSLFLAISRLAEYSGSLWQFLVARYRQWDGTGGFYFYLSAYYLSTFNHYSTSLPSK